MTDPLSLPYKKGTLKEGEMQDRAATIAPWICNLLRHEISAVKNIRDVATALIQPAKGRVVFVIEYFDVFNKRISNYTPSDNIPVLKVIHIIHG